MKLNGTSHEPPPQTLTLNAIEDALLAAEMLLEPEDATPRQLDDAYAYVVEALKRVQSFPR